MYFSPSHFEVQRRRFHGGKTRHFAHRERRFGFFESDQEIPSLVLFLDIENIAGLAMRKTIRLFESAVDVFMVGLSHRLKEKARI